MRSHTRPKTKAASSIGRSKVKQLLQVLRKPQYWESLQAIEDHIAHDNPVAAVDMWLVIDDQVSKLADPNFPQRPGRVPGTLEVVAHANYVAILKQTLDTATVLEVLRCAVQYPWGLDKKAHRVPRDSPN